MMVTDDNGCFSKRGISGISNIKPKKENIVVGANGSGKTRLLCALKEYFEATQPSTTIIYGYFPNLLGKYVTDDECQLKEPLFDILVHKKLITFDDYIKSIEADAESFIYSLFDERNRKYQSRAEVSNKAIKDLNGLLCDLIGYTLEVQNGQTIMKRNEISYPLKEILVKLSPGERNLFYISILLLFISEVYCKKNCILIIDEPELHIHPRVLVKFITYLRTYSENLQLWIATHSCAIVPEFDFENIIYIKEGEIQKRDSSLYRNIYESMMGCENKSIQQFLTSIDQWQYDNFVAECFYKPDTVDIVDKNDKQFTQFIRVINAHVRQKGECRILDFGAGSGRIGKCIDLLLEESDSNTVHKVQYDAYEPSNTCKLNDSHNVFSDINELISTKRGEYDFVIMMNVLHEIDPCEWKETFKNIQSLLRPNGFLLLIEANPLVHGEQPNYNTGYLVLSQNQMRILFGDSTITSLEFNKETDPKSNCYLIPARNLLIDDQEILSAIKSLERDTHNILYNEYKFKLKCSESYKNTPNNMRLVNSRKYAYYSQLYINSIMAIEYLKSKKIFLNSSVPKTLSQDVDAHNGFKDIIDKITQFYISIDRRSNNNHTYSNTKTLLTYRDNRDQVEKIFAILDGSKRTGLKIIYVLDLEYTTFRDIELRILRSRKYESDIVENNSNIDEICRKILRIYCTNVEYNVYYNIPYNKTDK